MGRSRSRARGLLDDEGDFDDGVGIAAARRIAARVVAAPAGLLGPAAPAPPPAAAPVMSEPAAPPMAAFAGTSPAMAASEQFNPYAGISPQYTGSPEAGMYIDPASTANNFASMLNQEQLQALGAPSSFMTTGLGSESGMAENVLNPEFTQWATNNQMSLTGGYQGDNNTATLTDKSGGVAASGQLANDNDFFAQALMMMAGPFAGPAISGALGGGILGGAGAGAALGGVGAGLSGGNIGKGMLLGGLTGGLGAGVSDYIGGLGTGGADAATSAAWGNGSAGLGGDTLSAMAAPPEMFAGAAAAPSYATVANGANLFGDQGMLPSQYTPQFEGFPAMDAGQGVGMPAGPTYATATNGASLFSDPAMFAPPDAGQFAGMTTPQLDAVRASLGGQIGSVAAAAPPPEQPAQQPAMQPESAPPDFSFETVGARPPPEVPSFFEPGQQFLGETVPPAVAAGPSLLGDPFAAPPTFTDPIGQFLGRPFDLPQQSAPAPQPAPQPAQQPMTQDQFRADERAGYQTDGRMPSSPAVPTGITLPGASVTSPFGDAYDWMQKNPVLGKLLMSSAGGLLGGAGGAGGGTQAPKNYGPAMQWTSPIRPVAQGGLLGGGQAQPMQQQQPQQFGGLLNPTGVANNGAWQWMRGN